MRNKIRGAGLCCDFCNAMFPHKHQLLYHIQKHRAFRDCPYCSKSFKKGSNYYHHIKIHQRSKSDMKKCASCPKSFWTSDALKTHIINVHEVPKTKIQCHICPKVCTGQAQLSTHMRIHLKAFMLCDLCGYKELHKSKLLLHFEVHLKESPWSCPECPKVFRSKRLMNYHINRIHKKNVVYPCKKCNVQFNREILLKFHMSREHPITWKCIHCRKILSSKRSLDHHIIRLHLGTESIPNFDCDYSNCNASFKLLVSLREHQNKVHNKPTITQLIKESLKDPEVLQQQNAIMEEWNTICEQKRENQRTLIMKTAQSKEPKPFVISKVYSGGIIDSNEIQQELDEKSAIRDINKIALGASKCSVCNKIFRFDCRRNAHEEQIHNPNNKFICNVSICQHAFKHSHNLKRHIETIHLKTRELKSFSCTVCGQTFDQFIKLITHRKVHQEKPKYYCDNCGTFKMQKHRIISHMISEHLSEKKFMCEICSSSFKTNKRLETHIKTHQLNRDYHCSQCPSTFKVIGAMKKHEKNHSLEKTFCCDEPGCKWKFKEERSLKLHKHCHAKTNDWICTLCNRALKTKDNLRRHTISYHTGGFKRISCGICKKSFQQKHLKSHLRSHTDLRIYECKSCHRSFKTFEGLSRHENTHEKASIKKALVKCPICPKMVAGPGQLGTHLLSHKKKNNMLKCDICGAQVPNYSQIVNHMESHIKDKPWKCSKCILRFKCKRHLKYHFDRVHCKDTYYPCDHCALEFNRKILRTRHIKKEHPETIIFQCASCNIVFKANRSLQYHLMTKHNDDNIGNY